METARDYMKMIRRLALHQPGSELKHRAQEIQKLAGEMLSKCKDELAELSAPAGLPDERMERGASRDRKLEG